MTTTELGINVGTGQSEEELNKLADSMDNVLAKFIKVMETAGRSEEAFQKIAGAIGIHQTKLKAMTDDVKKASMVLGPEIAKTNDMTIRGLSTNITKQFNKLSRDISAVFSLIPQELKKSTQEIANMTVAVNNNLGGIRVQAKEATDALFALATAEKKISKSITKPKVVEDTKTTTEMWGAKYNRAQALMEADAWDAAIKSAQKYEVEQAKIKKARDADNTNAVKTAITQYRSDRKDSFNTAAGVVERTEKDTIDYISFVKSKTEAVAKTLAEARAKGYIDVEEIKKVQSVLAEVNKETKSLSVANKDMSGDAGRAMSELSEGVNVVNKDFKTLRDTSKIGFMESLGIDIPKVKDLQESLSGVSREIKTLQTGKIDLEDLTRLKKELTDIGEKSKVIGAKNEEAAAKSYLRIVEDQINALELLNKEKDKESQHNEALNKEAILYEKVAKNINDAKNIAQKLTAQLKGVDTGVPMFEDLQGIQRTFENIERIKTSLKETIGQAKKLDDPMQLNSLISQLKIILDLEDKIKNAMKGMHPTEVGGISDPSITQFRQEIELLDKIKASLDKVAEARERLAKSGGSKSNTEAAKRDLAVAKAELDGYRSEKESLAQDLSRLGVTGSQAMRTINGEFQHLNKSINSFDGQIRGTEKSFKNMWGAFTVGMGKFVLFYHTVGIAKSIVGGFFDTIRSSLNSVMAATEPVTNLEKALRLMNETKGGITQARSEMAFFKKTANDLGFAYKDLSDSFKQFKDIADTPNGNYDGIMRIWKEMTAAAKATGQQGDLNDFFKGFTDAIGKGQIMAEELKKQLAPRMPGLIKGISEEIASFRGIDPKKFDIFAEMSKNTVKLSEFMAGFENFLPKWAKLGESMGDAYSSAVAKLSNAWTDLLLKISTSDAGKSIILMIEKMTSDLKNDDITRIVNDVVKSFVTISKTLLNIAEYIVPQIGRALRQIPGLNIDKGIAESNQTAYTAAQMSTNKLSNWAANYQTQQLMAGMISSLSQGISDTLGLGTLSGGYINPAGANRLDLAQRLASAFTTEDIGNLFAEGWLQAGEKGTLTVAKEARTQFDAHLLESSENMSKLVFDPLLDYLVSVDGDFSKVDKKIRQAQEAQRNATGSSPLLSIENFGATSPETYAQKKAAQEQSTIDLGNYFNTNYGTTSQIDTVSMPVTVDMGFSFENSIADFKEGVSSVFSMSDEETKGLTLGVADKLASQFGVNLTNSLAETTASLPSLSDMFKTSGFWSIPEEPGKATPEGYKAFDSGSAKAATPEQIAAVEAEITRLQGDIQGLQAGGSYARQKALVYARAQIGDLKDEVRKGATPEQKAMLDDLRKQKADLEASAIDKQAQQEVDSLKAEIEGKILSGRLKNQLKTQYDDIIKWQLSTTQKIEDKLVGSGFDTAGMKAQISQAVEVMSQEALTQGNTPMEIIAKAEKRAAEGRVDAWKSTHKELTMLMSQYNALQIEAQFDLMKTEDDISGERTEKEKKRIRDAAEENKKNFKNTKLQDEISQIAQLSKDMELLQNRQNFFGGMFDAAGTEEAAIAMDKLQAQLNAIVKEYGSSVPVMKEFGRLQQEINDKVIDKKISNASSFTEYLNIRMAKEQGLFDNSVVATQKQFEKMYEAVGGGAVEMGTTIEKSFTDAFTGTLKSWGDVWKEIQAIFLKTLAAMIWESKARPIVISAVSAFTGVAPALAGGSTQGNIASQAHDFVTGGSQSGGGIFSMFSKGMDKLTASVDTFGHSVLNFSEGVKLSSAIGYGALGYGIGYGVGGTATTGIGGALGGMAGNIAGSMVGQAFSSTLGATLSEAMPGIGALVGTALGTAISGVFSSVKKITDQGLRIVIGSTGAVFADSYTTTKKSSLFTSSTSTSYSTADHAVIMELNRLYKQSTQNIDKAMQVIGLSSTTSGFSLGEQNISWQGKEPKDVIEAWVKDTMSSLTNYVMGKEGDLSSFNTFKRIGEDSADTLLRLSEGLEALTENAVKASVEIGNLAGGLSGLNLASYASDLKDALGGDDGLSSFFGRIKNFIGYAGTTGIANIAKMNSGLDDSLKKITDLYNSRTNATNITQLQKQLQEQINIRDGSTGFSEDSALSKSWSISFSDEITAMLSESTKEALKKATEGRYNDSLNNLAFKAKDYEIVSTILKEQNKEAWYALMDRVEEYTNGWTGVNENTRNYLQASISIDRLTETIEKAQSGVGGAELFKVSPTSSTFWTDYQKALNDPAGLSPELAAAWDSAAKFAEDIASVRDQAEEARKAIEEQNAAYNRQREILAESAVMLGASSDALMDLSYKAQGMNQNDLPEWFAQIGDITASKLIPGLDGFIRTGETALDTIVRLTEALKATHDAAGVAGISLETISGSTRGIDIANYAQGLVDYFGSQDNLNAIFSAIGDAIYDDDGLNTIAVNYWKAQATAQAEALGTSLDAAKDFLKDKMSQTITDPALLNSYAQLATSINNMETAADSASGSVDSLADYLDEIRDKIKSLGMTDTESFLFDLQKEIEDMKKEILSRGGTESDIALADAYGVAAISNKLSESMDEVYASIRKLTTPDLIEQINQLSDSYWEQTQSAILLGASQEELNAILYNSYLQAKEVLKSAAQAYVQAYDDTLSQIEELKSKQQALEDDVADARNDYMASLQKEIDAKQEAIDALQENVDKLKDFVDNLKDLKDELATTAGFLSPTDKVGSTLSQFLKTASLAQAGNEDAMGSLSDKAKSALTAAESGSYQEYINTFVRVYGTVNSLQEETKKKYDPQKEQLDTLIASRDSLQSIYDQLKEDADITKSIADAQETYFKAQQDLSASTYKTQIDSLQQEVDQHEETVELLRSQYDTTMSLLDASLRYFEIQKRVGEILVDSTVSIVDENVKRRTYDKVYSTLTSLEEYLTPEVTKDGTDSGIKTIVSATSIKDGVLLAIRSSNDTDTVPATSLIGLLNTIKTNTTAA